MTHSHRTAQRTRGRFVVRVRLASGSLWLSCNAECAEARARIQRLLRQGRIREEGVVLDATFTVSLARPTSDCLELHIDVPRGIVKELRVKRGRGRVLAAYFIDDFARGLNRVRFTGKGPPPGVPP